MSDIPAKQCTKCKDIKELDNFYKNKNTKDGLAYRCKNCEREGVNRAKREIAKKEWRKNNPEKVKAMIESDRFRNYSRRKYGMSFDSYQELLSDQENKCAICDIHESKLKKRMAIDHCHENDYVRGLLCHRCNVGIGFFDDSADLLNKAIQYLEKARTVNKKAP